MRTCNHIFKTVPQFGDFLEGNVISCNAPMLVRIHTAVHNAQGMRGLLEELKLLLPNAQFIGCSSPAVIFNGTRRTDVCMISITAFSADEQCDVDSVSLSCFEEADGNAEKQPVSGEELAMQVISALNLRGRKGQLLVFLPQKYYQACKFAETIDRCCPDLRIIGGVANDQQLEYSEQGEISETDSDFTLSREFCGSGYLSAAVISSPRMHCYESYALGMEKISGYRKIDGCERNLIYSVNGSTPTQLLARYGGGSIKKENLDTIRIFPIIRKKLECCAWPMAFGGGDNQRDAVMVMDEIEQGEEVALGFISPSLVVDEVNRMYRGMHTQPCETIFAYSCTLRAAILQNCSEWEMSPLISTTASGAFLGGEFFYDGAHNRFGNCTFVVSALATTEQTQRLDTSNLSITHTLFHDNEHLIEFLTMTAVDEDGQDTHFRQEMKSRLYDTHKQRLGRFSKLFYDMQVHKVNKLCLIFPRNCSQMIAYAGYRAYDRLTWQVLERMQEFLKDYRCWYYLSDQGELMVSANDDVTAPQFEKLMHRLWEHLTQAEYYRIMPVFDFSLAMECPNLLRSVKIAQSELHHRSDLHFLVYDQSLGMESKNHHDMHMVQVIHDAIANSGVIPHYQGIHNNAEGKITMYESLMRIRDKNGRIYMPGEFLSVSKDYGLYGQLSHQMIAKVMNYIEERDKQVTMNLTMHDIIDPPMTELIYTNMQNSRHPENFVFEVVEDENITDYEAMKAFAARIHSYGGKIALDDFGSGFSNLINVIRLDLDFLKVDGGIIRRICEDSDSRQLLEIVSMWCKKNRKKVIAEFVENNAIQGILCNCKVDFSQGFLFAHPDSMIEN